MQSLPPGDCATMDSLLAYLSHQNIPHPGDQWDQWDHDHRRGINARDLMESAFQLSR